MRKPFLLALLASLCLCQTLPADGEIRFDVISDSRLECDADQGISISRRVRAGQTPDSHIHDLMLRKPALTDEWLTFSTTIFPDRDGFLAINLRAMSEGDEPLWIQLDAITVNGTELQNPDFEEVTSAGQLLHWGGKPENVGQDPGRAFSGSRYARVSYSQILAQRIAVRAGQRLAITFRYRPETVTDFSAPEGTNLVFDRQTAIKVLISEGRIECRPTFENCGVYINRLPAEKGRRLELKLFYREQGSETWLPALTPVFMPMEQAWRGSIMLLKEDCAYEVKAEISGESQDTIQTTFRTRSSDVPVARTVVLDPDTFTGQLIITESGTPDGYIRYTTPPGTTLVGAADISGGVLCVDKAQYILFEGIRIRANRAKHALFLDGAENIIVRQCEFFDFSRSDHVRDYRQKGVWTFNGQGTGWEGGIMLRLVKDVLVERTFIHSPHATSNSWFYSHPTGPVGIFMDRARGGVVLRYNDIIGSDHKRWNDAIESSGNGSLTGGFGRDADIYGNLMAFANDDCIEIEGGEMNIRVYLNRFEGSYCGVSTGACRLGPSYQFRNLYYRLSDENGCFGIPFKNGMGNQGYGAIYFINNTVVVPHLPSIAGGIHSRPPEGECKLTELRVFSRNNIFSCSEQAFNADLFNWPINLDYDLLDIATPEQQEANRKLLTQHGQQQNAIYAAPRYQAAGRGDFRLRNDSPGFAAAAPLPNLATRHVGAFQDDDIRSLPYRPLPVEADQQELFFPSQNAPLTQTFTVSAANPGFNSEFTMHANADFFTVTPDRGRLNGTAAVTFTVTLDPALMPRPQMYRGMALLRFADGLSRGISIYADYRNCPDRIAAGYKRAIVIPAPLKKGETGTFTVTIPAEGCYFIFTESNGRGWGRGEVSIGEVKTLPSLRHINRSAPDLANPLAAIREGHLSGYYFFLKPGEQQLTFRSETFDCSSIVITREPEWFLR